MIVAKFGGTSVSAAQRVSTICDIVSAQKNKRPVVVVSALSSVTDSLLSLSKSSKVEVKEKLEVIKNLHIVLIKNLFEDIKYQKNVATFINEKINGISDFVEKGNFDKGSLDKLASFGEIMSSYIIAKALNVKGIKAKQILATDLIITNNDFGSAEFLLEPTKKSVEEKLKPIIAKEIVPVVTGFIGSTIDGKTTTLGRGGSDYSASIIGFCLGASEIQIWTDVDGIFTADPRVVENAKPISIISYREASELATFGAKVLHPRTIKPAIEAGIFVRVLNTFNPKNKGTLIVEKTKSKRAITAISFKRRITLVNICSAKMFLGRGFLAKIFEIFSQNNISIDLVSVSEVSISVTLDNEENLQNALNDISKIAKVSIKNDLGLISLVGEGIVTSSKTIKKIFDLLDKEKILVKMVSLGATDINVSLVIEQKQVEQAVKILHNQLVLK